MKRTLHLLVVLVVAGAAGTEAEAHIDLVEPTKRYDDQKNPPCGSQNDARTDQVTTYQAGETIEIVWDEYINHPAHYRIAFDDDGQDDFEPPNCTANCDTLQNPEFEFYVNDTVLLDDIDDTSGGEYRVEVDLPDIACDNCTLQVIQVMYDKPPYAVPGNDIYYQCADLELVGDTGGMDAGTADASDSTDGTDTGAGDMYDATGSPDTGREDTNGAAATDTRGATGGGGNDTGRPADTGGANAGGSDDAPRGELESGCGVVGDGRPVPSSLIASLFLIVAIRRNP